MQQNHSTWQLCDCNFTAALENETSKRSKDGKRKTENAASKVPSEKCRIKLNSKSQMQQKLLRIYNIKQLIDDNDRYVDCYNQNPAVTA